MEPESSDGFTLGACFSELSRKTLIASALGFAIVFKGVETQDGKSLSSAALLTQLQFSSSALFFCSSNNVTRLPLLWALLTRQSNAHGKVVMECLLTGMAARGPQ